MPRTARRISWLVPLLVMLGSTAMAEPKPESAVGKAVAGIKGLLNPSNSSAIRILQTPSIDHWGKEKFDVSPVCASAPRFGFFRTRSSAPPAPCDPDLHLKYCDSQSECADGLTCRAMDVVRPSGKKVCAGHSDEHVDLVYRVVSSAESSVDLTSLYPYEGRYLTAIGRGLSDAARKKNLTVRLLYGADQTGAYYFGAYTNPKTYLTTLVGALDKDLTGDQLTIYASTPLRRLGTLSWNHAKMIGVDGKRAIVTGFNLKESHYLNERPVHDLGIAVEGSAALGVHAFANELWRACGDWVYTWNSTAKTFTTTGCPAAFDLAPKDPIPDGVQPYVVGVPRKGSVDDGSAEKAQPSDQMMLTMLKVAAETRTGLPIKISQQRMTNGSGRLAYWQNAKVMDELRQQMAVALIAGVPIHVVVSGTAVDKPPTANGYESEDPNAFILRVRAYLKARLLKKSNDELSALLDAMRTETGAEDARKRQEPRALGDGDRKLLGERGLGAYIAEYETRQQELAKLTKALLEYHQRDRELDTREDDERAGIQMLQSQKLRSEIEDIVTGASGAIVPTQEYIAACKLLTVKTVDFVKRPSSAYRPANHAKLLMVDDQAFYIGSHNMYESDLDEFGYFVDNKAAAKTLDADYWANLWTNSVEFKPTQSCDE